jgi:hypothetical protein
LRQVRCEKVSAARKECRRNLMTTIPLTKDIGHIFSKEDDRAKSIDVLKFLYVLQSHRDIWVITTKYPYFTIDTDIVLDTMTNINKVCLIFTGISHSKCNTTGI